jgi:SAM-dependent methyltransferase
MNHGTASDIPNIELVLFEIRRVLKTGGVFLLSFYNADALMYQTFLPWPPVLGAEVDKDEHYIEVACAGKILPVYAQAYTLEKAQALLPARLALLDTATHPTVGSIVPKDVFEGIRDPKKPAIQTDTKALETLRSLDSGLAQGNLGAYIILTGKKV